MAEGKLLELKNHLQEMQAETGGLTRTQTQRVMELVDGAIAEAEAEAEDYKLQEVREQCTIVMAQLENSIQAMKELGQSINNK